MRRRESHAEFVSTIRPVVSSVPIATIAASMATSAHMINRPCAYRSVGCIYRPVDKIYRSVDNAGRPVYDPVMSTTTRRRARHPRNAAATRERIVLKAMNAFSLVGYAGISLETIATAAGVRKATLFYYFDSKDDLYQ